MKQFTQRRARAAMTMLLLGLTSGSALAQSNEAWVSDELSTYVRSGPTDGYRIIGTLTAGEQVEVLETSGDYSRVRNSDGNAVWVLSNELKDTPSAREQLPALEGRVQALSTELAGINEQWEQRVASMTETLDVREKRISELENRNAALEEEANQQLQQVR